MIYSLQNGCQTFEQQHNLVLASLETKIEQLSMQVEQLSHPAPQTPSHSDSSDILQQLQLLETRINIIDEGMNMHQTNYIATHGFVDQLHDLINSQLSTSEHMSQNINNLETQFTQNYNHVLEHLTALNAVVCNMTSCNCLQQERVLPPEEATSSIRPPINNNVDRAHATPPLNSDMVPGPETGLAPFHSMERSPHSAQQSPHPIPQITTALPSPNDFQSPPTRNERLEFPPDEHPLFSMLTTLLEKSRHSTPNTTNSSPYTPHMHSSLLPKPPAQPTPPQFPVSQEIQPPPQLAPPNHNFAGRQSPHPAKV